MKLNEAIQLAIAICPLVIIDTVYANTVMFTFKTEAGAREFAETIVSLFSGFRIVRLDTEVLVNRV